MPKTWIIIFLFIFFIPAINAGAVEYDSIFVKAGNHFENKEYAKALDGYQILLDHNYESSSLYYNIGNCYIKEGRFGYAILYYLKAQRLTPGDEDINTNLAFARQFMPTRLEGVKINPVTEFLNMIVKRFTLDIMAWLSSIFFIIFIIFLSFIIHFHFTGAAYRIIGYSLLILLILVTGLTTYKYRTEYLTQTGVIVTDEANIYSSPGEEADLEFVGAFGLELEIEKSNNDYYLVIFENKRKGWIKKDNVGII